MRACFHLMVQNETKAYICCIFLFFIFFCYLAQTYEIFTYVCEVVQMAHFIAILKMAFA